ncbi:MAG: single-stranded-DNA-specific exonuclease RecJ [Ruminococcaceae bacterium]|nr:single-stranded-DNA-specific exonuclease RecJ [Oscillospiraceae bacterium]
MGRKIWNLSQQNKELASEIAERLSIDSFAAYLLTGRGIVNDEDILSFLAEDANLIEPFTLPDMQLAVDRINDAIFDYEKICIFGDYDADGITATALLYSYLETQGANVTYMLPTRADGYGLSIAVIDRIKAMEIDLIITVDNGVASVEEAKYIKSLGMELIVTDHHLPGDELPDCVAVVDPHRLDANCSYKDFAGVGVAFKLACAIEGDSTTVLSDYADLVAIGTIADIVPLTGENRILVKYGLRSFKGFIRPGLDALIKVTGLQNKEINSSSISFGLAPRINAAGRMAIPDKALDLLLCEEDVLADELAIELNEVNSTRHSIVNEIVEECIAFLNKHPKYTHYPVLVLHGKGWHDGVLGIVASKLLERYMKPTIVLSDKEDGTSKGSARSVQGFSLFDALTECSGYLNTFGGHEGAAGLSLNTNKIDSFIMAISKYAWSLENFYPSIDVSCKLKIDAISLELIDILSLFEPFGAHNPSPVFALYDLHIDSVSELGENRQHIKIIARKENSTITLMYFNIVPGTFAYIAGDKIDVLVTLDKNEWNGSIRVSAVVKDIRPSGIDDNLMVKSEKLFDKVSLKRDLSVEELDFATPDRDLCGNVYTYLKQTKSNISNYEYIASKVWGPLDNLCRVRIALLSLRQLGLINIAKDGTINVPNTDAKVDLFSAPVMEFLSSAKRG